MGLKISFNKFRTSAKEVSWNKKLINFRISSKIINILAIIFTPFVGHVLSASQLPDTEKICVLGDGLRFIDCQDIRNQEFSIEDWDNNTVRRRVSVSYGIKPALGWFSSEPIPIAIQTIKLGKYFCLFDCRTAI